MLVVYFNKESARIYRRREIRQKDGAYKRLEDRLGDLPLDAKDVPSTFPKLNEREKASLNVKFFEKAKFMLEQRRLAAQEEKLDPLRVISPALELLRDAAERSQHRAVDDIILMQLLTAVCAVQSSNPLFLLSAVRDVAHSAACAVAAGKFGTRPENLPLSSSEVAQSWNEVRQKVVGAGAGSLLRALQEFKWVRSG